MKGGGEIKSMVSVSEPTGRVGRRTDEDRIRVEAGLVSFKEPRQMP